MTSVQVSREDMKHVTITIACEKGKKTIRKTHRWYVEWFTIFTALQRSMETE